MKIPLSWLKEYIHLHQTPAEIAKLLTQAGLEVDDFTTVNLPFEGVVVGRVISTEKHPNADKLTVATVTDGKSEFQVVCGAPNCRSGMKTAFAPVGAKLKEDNGKDFVIKNAKLRGVESFGMLCSGKELGLSEDADGIMELSSDTPEGTYLIDLYADTIFDISLTPNLAYCQSVIGVARELSALTGLPLHVTPVEVKESDENSASDARLTVLDQVACPRYVCRLIKNVKVGPSPEWVKIRLEKAGLRSVNNIVDITNYVLLEMGHPLHAFDFDRLAGHSIVVKKAVEGERFTTLDGKERILTNQDLMISDLEQSVAIAGVMGGQNSEVTDQTQNVLLESAYFDPITIRKTSKRLGLQTDASKRFEKGTDPNIIIRAADRAALLMQQLAGGSVSAGILEASAKVYTDKVIKCRLNRTNQLLGIQIGRGELESIFQRLQFPAKWEAQDTLAVQVPTYRVDIKAEVDLIEEVARLYGYDNIPKTGGYYRSSPIPHAPIYLFEKEIQSKLIGEGLQEFVTCDLIGPTLMNIVQDPKVIQEHLVSVLNPTSIEQSVLRTSLLPGLLQVAKYNIDHQNHDIAGFEVGRIHFKEKDSFKEQSIVGILLTGKSRPSHWKEKPHDYDFYDLKGIIENLLSELNIANPIYRNMGMATFHSGRQASVFVDALEVGSFGEIHPAILRRLDVPQRLFFAEFNLHDLIQLTRRQEKTNALAIFPASERDWTITLNTRIPYADVLQAIKEASIPLLESVSLTDIYRHEKLGQDVQNVTLRFTYRDAEKTIAQEDVEREHQQLVTAVTNKLGLPLTGV